MMGNGQMMGILWVILALVIIAGVLVMAQAWRIGRPRRDDAPEQALKRRYAKGEIDRDTYERMLEDLRK